MRFSSIDHEKVNLYGGKMNLDIKKFCEDVEKIIPTNTDTLVVHGGIWSFAKNIDLPDTWLPARSDMLYSILCSPAVSGVGR